MEQSYRKIKQKIIRLIWQILKFFETALTNENHFPYKPTYYTIYTRAKVR